MPDADTPPRIPRRDNRQQWTLKHRDLTPELRALVAKAAELQGMPVGQWVAHVLCERGQAVVRGDGKPIAGCLRYPRNELTRSSSEWLNWPRWCADYNRTPAAASGNAFAASNCQRATLRLLDQKRSPQVDGTL